MNLVGTYGAAEAKKVILESMADYNEMFDLNEE